MRGNGLASLKGNADNVGITRNDRSDSKPSTPAVALWTRGPGTDIPISGNSLTSRVVWTLVGGHKIIVAFHVDHFP